MNRRSAISSLALSATGLIILPQWMVSCGISDTNTHNSSFSDSEQKILASIADTIIPAGNSIGALSVGVDKFLQKLFDECYDQKVQDNIKKQLGLLDKNAQTNHKKSFTACDQSTRQQLLNALASSSEKDSKDFFELIKSETIRGFTTSQKVMEEYLGYKVAPGHYYGCVNIKS